MKDVQIVVKKNRYTCSAGLTTKTGETYNRLELTDEAKTKMRKFYINWKKEENKKNVT